MKREQINIRDPYVMKAEGRYYLYGTRSATTWGPADGFDCYFLLRMHRGVSRFRLQKKSLAWMGMCISPMDQLPTG